MSRINRHLGFSQDVDDILTRGPQESGSLTKVISTQAYFQGQSLQTFHNDIWKKQQQKNQNGILKQSDVLKTKRYFKNKAAFWKKQSRLLKTKQYFQKTENILFFKKPETVF